jgi:translocation and assembly module TamB
MEIHAAAEGRKVSITQARATDGEKGIVEAQGWLDIAPQQDFPFQVDIDLKEVTLVRLDRATSEVDGHVELSGSLKDLGFVGEVTVGPTELRLPNRMPPEIKELEVIEINRSPETTQTESIPKKATEPGRLRLDLELDLRGPVFVRGRGLDSEWKGKLRITGTSRDPVIRGTLSTVRGRFNLFGKSLSLTRGTITFDGNVPPSPFFDVVSEGKQGDMTAYIGLSGTPSALSVTLESDPPFPSDEVLSRLLFGRSVTELTPIQGAKLAAAVSALTGTGGGVLDVMDRTRRLVGLDDLDVKESDEAEGEAAVSAGKYLTEDVYVEVQQGIGSTRGKVSVEYEVQPNVSVETEAGTDAEGGIGLNWKWDY